MSVKLTQMRHFLGVADELHFGRAAAKLGIAQPPLSQSISRLETQLGVLLVNRDRNRISLTPAGEAFAREVRIVLRQAAVAEQTARRVDAGEVEELSVGFAEPAMFRLMPTALLRFRLACPKVRLRLLAENSPVQLELLQRGELDLAVILPRPGIMDDVNLRVVESSPLVACVPDSSPLAKLERVTLRQLANERFILYPPAVEPHGHELIIDACRLAGFTPQIEEQSVRSLARLRLVASGVGITFVQASAQYNGFKGLKFLPVDDLPDIQCQLLLAWREGYAPPPLLALIEVFSGIGLDGPPRLVKPTRKAARS